MKRTALLLRLQPMSIVLVVMLGLALALPLVAEAVTVDCGSGQTIKQALTLAGGGGGAGPKQLVITVRGTCNENVVIARDDVTINTNGVVPATIASLNASQPAVLLDGARRIVIDGVVANGITLSGGPWGLAVTRGSTSLLANCDVSGATNSAVISSYGSTLEVDKCVLHNNNRGGTAANDSGLVVTNSTVRDNTNEGLLAVRSSYLRVGQDRGGNPVPRPVTVNNNGTHGISVVDSSSGTIVASNIHHNGGSSNSNNGVLFTRGSAGTVGTGPNGLVSPNTIQNNSGTGVIAYQTSAALIQGNTINSNGRGVFVGPTSSATIIGNSIQNNAERGVQVVEGGSARIGVVDAATSASGNTISGNTSDGIGIFNGGEGVVAGNTISSNGGNGINMNMGTMNLVGGNTISANAFHGINARASRIFQAPGTFGTLPDTADVSQSNGLAGMFLFNSASVDLFRITLTNNARQGISASLNSTINLAVYDPARPNNLIRIINNGTGNVANNNDGITLFRASVLSSPLNPGGPGQVIITGHPGWGVNCFGTTAAVGMDTTGISSNALGTLNCGGF